MIIAVTPEGPPPSRQVCDQISGLITAGTLGRGQRLPSVRQLASDLGVAPGTVAKAYRMLEAEGLVTSRPGASTRVSDTASAVSAEVADAARAFVAAAGRDGLSLDDATRLLRTIW